MNLERKTARLAMATFIIMMMVSMTPQDYEVAAEFTNSQSRTDLTGINVAVYWGTALHSVVASTDALVHMYEWMNATVDIVNETQVKEGILEDYQIFAMPGGNPVTFKNRFGSAGRAAIHDWVRRGGSYFGICGGAMFATRLTSFNGDSLYFQLNLFNGTVFGPITGVSGMTKLHVNTSCTGPDLSDLASTTLSNYQGGGYYVADEGQEMLTLATYDVNSEASIIASACGSGTFC
ncbi:MAG: BPL-N domain-containing protein, partial [Candidatus Thorarchaeota archaeon]|nr:BPL-N domain-containing protein [Candidatus Thorarchaeota archaeon]